MNEIAWRSRYQNMTLCEKLAYIRTWVHDLSLNTDNTHQKLNDLRLRMHERAERLKVMDRKDFPQLSLDHDLEYEGWWIKVRFCRQGYVSDLSGPNGEQFCQPFQSFSTRAEAMTSAKECIDWLEEEM